MKKSAASRAGLFFALSLAPAWAAEPLVGTWLRIGEELAGEKRPSKPIVLRVREVDGTLQFTYALNGGTLLTMKFGARLNGPAGSVYNGAGTKIGTVTISKVSDAEYKVALQDPGKPPVPAKWTLSEENQKLTIDSDMDVPQRGRIRVVQTYTRH